MVCWAFSRWIPTPSVRFCSIKSNGSIGTTVEALPTRAPMGRKIYDQVLPVLPDDESKEPNSVSCCTTYSTSRTYASLDGPDTLAIHV